MPAKKLLTTYMGKEYNRTHYPYKATMEYYYVRDGLVRTDNKLRTYQNLLENEPYTPYLDSFNVTGLLDWYYHPRMMNKSNKMNARRTFTGNRLPFPMYGTTSIWFPDPEPEVFKIEYYQNPSSARLSQYSQNRLSARNLKPKHFAYYYRHFDRLDREYGKIFDLKTGRMYPEAKEKFWPDAIDNIGITNPNYSNPRLKPENWRDKFFRVYGEKDIKEWDMDGSDLRLFDPFCRNGKLDELIVATYGTDGYPATYCENSIAR